MTNDDYKERVLGGIADLKAAVGQNREAHGETRERLARIEQRQEDFKEDVAALKCIPEQIASIRESKADRSTVDGLLKENRWIKAMSVAIVAAVVGVRKYLS